MEGQRVRCCHLSPRLPPRRFLHACGVCWLSVGYPRLRRPSRSQGRHPLNPVSAITGATADRILDDQLVAEFCRAAMREAAVIGDRIGCRIAVTPEQLHSTGSQLNAGAANIESILSQLASQVAPLQSEWQGVAQARFQELWAEWQRSSRGIQEALHGISQLTQQAGTNYADTEQGIASSFGR